LGNRVAIGGTQLNSEFTAFSDLIDFIRNERIHHPRTGVHSDILSKGLLNDLCRVSDVFLNHAEEGEICYKLNMKIEDASRHHVVDLVIGRPRNKGQLQAKSEQLAGDGPLCQCVGELVETRIIIENKSLVTAHRNVFNRTRILTDISDFVRNSKHKDAILIGTFLVGTAERFLNYETFVRARDVLNRLCKKSSYDFDSLEKNIGTGSRELRDFVTNPNLPERMVSVNRTDDPKRTLQSIVGDIPVKTDTKTGYDALIIQFCHIDNVDPPRLDFPDFFDDPSYSHFRYDNAMKHIGRIYDDKYR
jgi:hypothetical protein